MFTNIPDDTKTPNSTGDTEDYGLKFGLFGGRVADVFSLFKATNNNNDNVRSINFGELSSLFELIGTVKYARYINVPHARETQDIESTGWELQLTANLSKKWRATVTANERAYRTGFLTNYSFTEGFLKDVAIGVNAHWQSEPVTGFALQRIGTTFGPDPSKPFYGSDMLRVGAHLSYSRPLWGNRLRWRVQLNVQDIGTVDPFVVRQSATAASPTAPVTLYWHRGYPQTFILTNTFQF